jgi:DNA-binding response OmpR family regulator
MKLNQTVLCVDDDEDNNELFQFLFEQDGYQVTVCSSADECLQIIRNDEFTAVILDYLLPDRDGLEVCREIRDSGVETPIIFYSGDTRETTSDAAIEAGADAFLVKPNDLMEVVQTVTKLVKARAFCA